MQTISMYDANDFKQRVTIENTLYILHFSWNGTEWNMDIRDSSNNDIVRNIVLVPNFPLLLQYQRHIDIKGQLLAVRNDSTTTISRTDFVNKKATLVYMSLEDVQDAVS